MMPFQQAGWMVACLVNCEDPSPPDQNAISTVAKALLTFVRGYHVRVLLVALVSIVLLAGDALIARSGRRRPYRRVVVVMLLG